MSKATHGQTKTYNTELVLRTIYRHAPVSRAQVSDVTNLTRPTVSKIVADLEDRNLVVEIGVGQSTGGKRPRLLQINKDEHFIVAADVSNHQCRGALLNLHGSIKHRAAMNTVGFTREDAVYELRTLLERLHKAADKPILGIGIGSPGLINSARGVVINSVNLEWRGLALKEKLARDYGDAIYIVNDSQAAALGEFTFGESDGSGNLVLIHLGTGVGAGLIMNNRLYSGDGFGAGEIGHVRFNLRRRLTYEQALSKNTLLREARDHVSGNLTWDLFVARVAAGDKPLRGIVRRAADRLGVMLAHLIATLDANRIVLSGPLTDLGDLLVVRATEVARSRVLPAVGASMTIRTSALGEDLVLLGCGALVLYEELGVI